MAATTFAEWLANAKPGERYEYHRGLLMQAIATSFSAERHRELAWDAYLAGRVHLVQRRYDPTSCSYFAVMR